VTAPTYPFTDEGLSAALKALGRTDRGVAHTLEAMGIKGCLSDENDCPVAHYILAVVAGAEGASVEIDMCKAVLRDPDSYADVHVFADTPVAVSAFMLTFDLKGHPDLIQEDSK
jgi:hypothetical protein